jgi:hypothetical protein
VAVQVPVVLVRDMEPALVRELVPEPGLWQHRKPKLPAPKIALAAPLLISSFS